jgi:hypothetical protein
VGLHEGHELVVVQRQELGGGHGGGGGGARARVEQGQLADDLAGAEHREQVLAAVGAGVAELHLPGEENVEAVA